MKLFIACDHAGIELKDEIKKYLSEKGYDVADLGINTGEKIDIDLVTYGSGKKVKWVCSKCGYVWVKEIHSRTIYKSKCPFCKRVNRKK